MKQVKQGDTIKVHYTGTLEDGSVFDTSQGRDPLEFTVGSGQVIVGFDEAVKGMSVGDKKSVAIPCAKAYGEFNSDLGGGGFTFLSAGLYEHAVPGGRAICGVWGVYPFAAALQVPRRQGAIAALDVDELATDSQLRHERICGME